MKRKCIENCNGHEVGRVNSNNSMTESRSHSILGPLNDHITNCLKHVQIQPVCGIFPNHFLFWASVFCCGLWLTSAAPHPKICCRSSFLLTDLFGPSSPARPLALFPADDLVFSLWLCALKLCGKGAPTVPSSCEPDTTCPSFHIWCFFIVCEYVAVRSVFISFVCQLESELGNLTATQSCLTKWKSSRVHSFTHYLFIHLLSIVC